MREVDVVLVDGTIVTATPTNAYADLFRALKGGTNRFGIVTRYVVDAIPTGTKEDKRWFGGEIIVSVPHLPYPKLYIDSSQIWQYDNSTVDAVLTALSHYALNIKDPKAGMSDSSLSRCKPDSKINPSDASILFQWFRKWHSFAPYCTQRLL